MAQSHFYGRGGAGNHRESANSTSCPTAALNQPILYPQPTNQPSSASQSKQGSHSNSTGRGGAGNHILTPSSVSPSPFGPAGPGGAVQMERPQKPVGYPPAAIFPFDEELALYDRRFANPAPIYRVGRGGAGNVARTSNSPFGRSGSSNYAGIAQAAARGGFGPLAGPEEMDDCGSLAGSSVSSAGSGGHVGTPPIPVGAASSSYFAFPAPPPQLQQVSIYSDGPTQQQQQQQQHRQPKQRRGGWKAWGL